MKLYLTYNDYTGMGGTLSESVFTRMNRKAQMKLDIFTYNRLQDSELNDTDTEKVKNILFEYVESINTYESRSGTITSYSNGVESFGYANKDSNTFNVELQSLAINVLPVWLVSGVASDVR